MKLYITKVFEALYNSVRGTECSMFGWFKQGRCPVQEHHGGRHGSRNLCHHEGAHKIKSAMSLLPQPSQPCRHPFPHTYLTKPPSHPSFHITKNDPRYHVTRPRQQRDPSARSCPDPRWRVRASDALLRARRLPASHQDPHPLGGGGVHEVAPDGAGERPRGRGDSQGYQAAQLHVQHQDRERCGVDCCGN